MSKNNENKLVPKLRFPEFVQQRDWDKKALKNVSEVTMGSSPSSKSYNENRIGLPLLQGNADIKNRLSSPRIFTSEITKECQINDILLSVRAPVGTVAKSLHNACIGRGIAAIRAVDKNSQEYLYQWLISNESAWQNISQGGTFDAVNSDDVKNLLLPIPLPQEQQKIAACLSSLDEVITAESQKLEVLKDHKKGLLQNLLPQAGESVPKFRFKEFENSGEWMEKKLGDISENIMYGMNAAAAEFDGKNKYIRITDIDESTRKFSPNPITSPEGLKDEKYLVKVGDILFARTGASVGKSYYHNEENENLFFAGFLIRFSIKDANPYLVYLQTLTAKYQKWVAATSIRSGQPGINAEEYKEYSFLLPENPKEQEKIADTLSSIDDLIKAQNQKLETLQLHKKGLLQGLFPILSETGIAGLKDEQDERK